MYITYRNWLKNGNEFDETVCTRLEHETLDKAISYAHRYARGTKFISVTVEDDAGNVLYEICDYGAKVFDYRDEVKKEIEKVEEEHTRVKNMIGTIQEVMSDIPLTIPNGTKVKIVGVSRLKSLYNKCPVYIVEYKEGYEFKYFQQLKSCLRKYLSKDLEPNTKVWTIFECSLKGFGDNK